MLPRCWVYLPRDAINETQDRLGGLSKSHLSNCCYWWNWELTAKPGVAIAVVTGAEVEGPATDGFAAISEGARRTELACAISQSKFWLVHGSHAHLSIHRLFSPSL